MDASIRIEKDSLGEIEVPAAHHWGAQTQRSLHFFAIGAETMPVELLVALIRIKKWAAVVNRELGLLDLKKSNAIEVAADKILQSYEKGEWNHWAEEFPLRIWQTGSGTQTNMNVNEVLANLANQQYNGDKKIHPNDDVNLGQSSNDVFPTAMHIASAYAMQRDLLPALRVVQKSFSAKADEFKSIIKIGRTHLQDATPISLGQEFSGYAAQLDFVLQKIEEAVPSLYELALGGTAVGTGLNTHVEFAPRVAKKIEGDLNIPFVSGHNKFELLASHERLIHVHGCLRILALALYKIANDIRYLASGPRAGLGEISLPENEPGSSIMPGKVNPTQCEALTMVCCQVCGHDSALSMAGAAGAFELNVYKPLIIFNVLNSIQLLSSAMASFNTHCVVGITANRERISDLLQRSLMLVTALTPHIGYDRAAQIAKHAHEHGTSLREAATELKYVTEEDFDLWVQAEQMLEARKSN